MEEDKDGRRRRVQQRAKELGYAFADVDRVIPDRSALDAVTRELVVKHSAVALKKEGSVLYVAMARIDIRAIEAFREASRCRVVPVLALEDSIRDSIERLYPA